MKWPNIYDVRAIVQTSAQNQALVNGKWVPLRPVGYPSIRHRLKAAWLVLTGRADAVVWPGQ